MRFTVWWFGGLVRWFEDTPDYCISQVIHHTTLITDLFSLQTPAQLKVQLKVQAIYKLLDDVECSGWPDFVSIALHQVVVQWRYAIQD